VLVSRRDINKAETRAAIAESARKILNLVGLEGLTAEKIAEAAGVSRRTFFNYFPSVDSALNVPIEHFIERVLTAVEEVDDSASLAEAAVQAVQEFEDIEAYRSVAEMFVLAQNHPPLARLQTETWDSCAFRLADFVESRYGQPLDLDAYAFVFSITGAGKAAFAYWAQESAGDLSDDSMKKLHSYLVDALATLRDGFPTIRNFSRGA